MNFLFARLKNFIRTNSKTIIVCNNCANCLSPNQFTHSLSFGSPSKKEQNTNEDDSFEGMNNGSINIIVCFCSSGMINEIWFISTNYDLL